MLLTIDVSDMALWANKDFLFFEPHLMCCAIDFCASYKELTYDQFYANMIEYFFDSGFLDCEEDSNQFFMDRINDLEEWEFNQLCVVAHTIYERTILNYKHILKDPVLGESVLVSYQGSFNNHRLIQVDVELDAPDEKIAQFQAKFLSRRKSNLPIIKPYIPEGI